MANELCPPLTGNWTHPDSRLVFSTTNRTVGTVVKVSCDRMYTSAGQEGIVSRMLRCGHNKSWNDTLPACPILQTSITSPDTRPISTEVIIIWSIGGALLLLLVSLLIAIICAKRKDSRERPARQPRHPRPISTIGLQNPGFVSILDQVNHHCMITEGGGCRSPQFVYPAAPPPYPGSLPRGSTTTTTNAGNNTSGSNDQPQTQASTQASVPTESINSLPRPEQPTREMEVRPSELEVATVRQAESRIPRAQTSQTLQQTARIARPRDTVPQSSAHTQPQRPATMQNNRQRVQGRQSRICAQPRRLAPESHMRVPVTDIMDPPPPYTPYPDYDLPSQPPRSSANSQRRGPERLQSIYI